MRFETRKFGCGRREIRVNYDFQFLDFVKYGRMMHAVGAIAYGGPELIKVFDRILDFGYRIGK
jgi:hypothetical protein